MYVNFWSDDRTARLKELYATGASCGWIVADLANGITRNAVIGKVHRLGLERRGAGRHPLVEKRSGEPRQAPKASAKSEVPKSPPFRPRVMITPATEIELRCVEVAPRHLTLLDLEPNDCRYPYGHSDQGEGITFCGHPKIDGSSYCAPHFVLTKGDLRGRHASSDRQIANLKKLTRSATEVMQMDVFGGEVA
jgi:GcrA cell cycle regulator